MQLIDWHFLADKAPKDRNAEGQFQWHKIDCEIKGEGGKTFFSQKDVEAPVEWSQLAVEIAASKYFRRSEGENSVRKLNRRVVDAITKAGLKQKHLRSKKEAQIFAEELKFILLSQRASFNSPVWFNCGLSESYGIKSDAGAWIWSKNKAVFQRDAYKNPQVSACFIQKIEDSIDGIFDLVKNEARLFKFGSGSGTNFSPLRSKYENLKSGGTSSGLISFLEVLDRAAGSIKSGGTTRRAAKMVCLDVDHPEIEEFVVWKHKEELKAQALIREGYDPHFEGDAYHTVAGQNANNSVRLNRDFFKAVDQNKTWDLKSRTSGKVVKSVKARELWDKICESAWACADPGLQFNDTINAWHTCPAAGKINASNPCSEYMFLDDSACNLASINLLKYLDKDGLFDLESYLHTVRVLLLAQEILVDYASYPTARICKNSHDYRPLGLGFCGLGALLMRLAIPYDSDQGRAVAGLCTALLHGEALLQSTRIAARMGSFKGYTKNKKFFHKVVHRHELYAKSLAKNFESQKIKKVFRMESLGGVSGLLEQLYSRVLTQGRKYGYRNAQVTVMAPTGTIGLVMDCDTTGIEPEFSLIKHKKLVGGGHLKIVSQSVQPALMRLGYSAMQIENILIHIEKHEAIEGARDLKSEHLPVFDGAQRSGKTGKRFLSGRSHLLMMSSIQPFLSGAISKTVNLPNTASVADISEIYRQAQELGLKAIAIYRDACKASQPLSSSSVGTSVGTSVGNSIATSDPIDVPKCTDCGAQTEIIGGCFRCPECGFTTGCVS
jgi:ribonucleoside-diphosphate reductase alpha chain